MSSIAIAGRVSRKSDETGNGSLQRIFLVIIGVLSIILVLQVMFHLLIAPRLRVSTVEIIADRGLSLTNAEVLEIAGVQQPVYLFALDEAAIVARLRGYPAIRSASVDRSFPNTLRISIERRVPLVISLVEIRGRTVPVVMDRDGVIFEIGRSVSEYDLPVVSGLTFADVRLGQRMNPALTSFLEDLEKLRKIDARLFNLISECKFVTKNQADFEVLLFPRDYPVEIRIGNSIDAELFRRILLVLDVFASEEIEAEIEEIDFRTREVVTRLKER